MLKMKLIKFSNLSHVDCVDCGQCVRVCPWTYAYTLAAIHAVNKNKQERLVVQPRTVVGPRPHEINCSNALNFMTSTDAIAAKNAFVLITNLFVIKTNAFFNGVRAVMKFKALGNYFA